MLSPNSMSAFSGPSTAAQLHRSPPVRLARGRGEDTFPSRATLPDKPPSPGDAVKGMTPRGSLLNISV